MNIIHITTLSIIILVVLFGVSLFTLVVVLASRKTILNLCSVQRILLVLRRVGPI